MPAQVVNELFLVPVVQPVFLLGLLHRLLADRVPFLVQPAVDGQLQLLLLRFQFAPFLAQFQLRGLGCFEFGFRLAELRIQILHLHSQARARLFLGVLQQRFPLLGDAREDLLLQRLPRGFEVLLLVAQLLLALDEIALLLPGSCFEFLLKGFAHLRGKNRRDLDLETAVGTMKRVSHGVPPDAISTLGS